MYSRSTHQPKQSNFTTSTITITPPSLLSTIPKHCPSSKSSLNLLHLIVYFPGDIYETLSTLLTSCPEAITAVDNNGKTPMHHVITSTRHCPDTVVHQAIRSGGLCWDDLHELVKAKIDALTLDDVESGLYYLR